MFNKEKLNLIKDSLLRNQCEVSIKITKLKNILFYNNKDYDKGDIEYIDKKMENLLEEDRNITILLYKVYNKIDNFEEEKRQERSTYSGSVPPKRK